MGLLDSIIFKDKKFSDLLEEIYDLQQQKNTQVTALIQELKPLVQEIGDATLIVPLIKEYLEISIKNNEQLVKMAGIVQRTLQSSTSGDEFGLSDEEKEQIEVAVKGLEDAVKAENVEQIEEVTKALNDVLTPLSSKLYNQQQDGQPNTSEGTEDSKSSDDNTVEADFEEVQEEDK